MTLLVETATGAYLRQVQPATLLPADSEIGGAAEEATRGAAAAWGMPDFVFRPELQLRGSGHRELGDAILVVGPIGVSVQVKARRTPTGEVDREALWLGRKISQAARQAEGTIRSLSRTRAVTLTNERGGQIDIQPADVRWAKVVVLEHPGVDGYLPESDTVVMLRRDWEFLFDQLRSTYAVVEYLHRITGENPVALGLEPVRYYRYAAADAATSPSAVDERLAPFVSNQLSNPLLPQQPVASEDDESHRVYRLVLEDLATSPRPPHVDPRTMNELLAAVDAMPVAYRAELGRTLVAWLHEVANVTPPAIMWRFRIHTWPDRPLLLFATASRYEPRVMTAFAAWVSLRHQEFIELIPDRQYIQTVGVLLTPRSDGTRPWDTTMVAARGDQQLPPEERTSYERAWGRLGERRPPTTS